MKELRIRHKQKMGNSEQEREERDDERKNVEKKE